MSNNISNSIKLDYYILKSSDFRRIGIVAVIALFVGVVTKDPPLMIGIIMMISGFFMSTIFAVVEKNNLDKLYGVLPVKKQQTVLGRYLFTVITGVVIAIIATLLSVIVSLILQIPISGFGMAVWLGGSFLLFSLLVSLQFPLYFKYDFSKLAAMANLPYVILIIAGSYLIQKDPGLFASLVKFFTVYPAMIWVIGILVIVALLGISMLVSMRFYKNRE